MRILHVFVRWPMMQTCTVSLMTLLKLAIFEILTELLTSQNTYNQMKTTLFSRFLAPRNRNIVIICEVSSQNCL